MLARVCAAAVVGIEAVAVSVEVDVSPGLPGVIMVGLPDATVRESRDRVRSAIRNSGFPFPGDRVVVSLAPADLKKVGAAFDLPIALGILAASGVLPHREGAPITVVGGLSLDGRVPPMSGLLPIAIAARGRPLARLMFPAGNLAEAAIVRDVSLFPVASLWDAVQIYSAPSPVPVVPPPEAAGDDVATGDDLADVRGQLVAKRALEIAASGGHHLLLSGPPGAGKTMIARRLPGVLPRLTVEDALTVTAIHSVAGLLAAGDGLVRSPPFRAPHHTCSDVALVGGGAGPRPGELSLAHGGVLFLDELPEFGRRVLENLRQPLEHGSVHVARANRSVVFPARVMLVGAMNPCPCGHLGDRLRACRCPPGMVERYQQRLSGPLRDRFDLYVDVQAVPYDELRTTSPQESTAAVRARVADARSRQLARQSVLNGRLEGRSLRTACAIEDDDADALLAKGAARLGLSARAVTRVLRVARTIADLSAAESIRRVHLAEALQFRGPSPKPSS